MRVGQAKVLAGRLQERGYRSQGREAKELLHTAMEAALGQFDRAARQFVRTRQEEYGPKLAEQLTNDVIDAMVKQAERIRAAAAGDGGGSRRLQKAGREHAMRLAGLPRQEELEHC